MPKNIVLCSDGTGNKGGYGEDTNVYKVYKAVDIHNKNIQQITFYDQGVGTDKSDNSKNKYRTAISSAFGFGFEANVRHLYHFLARTYEPGDAVFLFGFSRGAATVRAFAGLINDCGLIDRKPYELANGCFAEHNFRVLVKEALSCYQNTDKEISKDFKNRYAIKHQEFAPDGNLKINLIGVWDTVSALGFPQDFSVAIEWLFKWVDNISDKFLPHNFYDYELNPNIENAYQALAIDDERTTFHPKVWDEHNFPGYVEQVWFAGVHSNVGGGYPRTGMSDVALEWMMAKAEAHGLVFTTDHKEDMQESANVFDKLYNSRDGIAVYYRYGPRNLEELCQGKLTTQNNLIAIHETAYKKIKDISDTYAPDGLPSRFNVVDIDPASPGNSITQRVVAVAPSNQANWNTLADEMNGFIKNRQILYRVFVEMTMLILVLSALFWLHPEWVGDSLACTEFKLLSWIANFLIYITPGGFKNFITYVVCVQPLVFLGMLAVLCLIYWLSKSFTSKLDQVCRERNELL